MNRDLALPVQPDVKPLVFIQAYVKDVVLDHVDAVVNEGDWLARFDRPDVTCPLGSLQLCDTVLILLNSYHCYM